MKDLRRILERARATPNRADAHIFMGDPRSDGCDKTTVEPGNSYSPGIWTCGISLWIGADDVLVSPDTLPADEIFWTLIPEPGEAPVAEAGYRAGRLSIRHRLAHLGTDGSEGTDFNIVEIESEDAVSASCVVVVRDVGPAGGRISGLEWDGDRNTLRINTSLTLVCEQKPDKTLVAPADDEFDSPAAALAFSLDMGPGESRTISFRTNHGFDERPFAGPIPKRHEAGASSCGDAVRLVEKSWKAALPARVFAPDPRVAPAWERCAWHILAAVELGIPRIGVVNYPVFWMRDCVIVLRALDFIGRHDLAGAGNEYMAPLYFSGGFGAESDAPGEGIWALVSHAKIVRDWEWCGGIFPHIAERIGWIERMLSAGEPIRVLTENRAPLCQNTPGGNILCLAARDGLIRGRMDFHSPDFYINCWAVAGLRFGALAAGRLGHDEYAARWTEKADELERRIETVLLPALKNPRDGIVTPYPSRALAGNPDGLKEAFETFYRAQRIAADGTRIPEREWTYFEAAQAHNAFLLGMRNEAWISMNGMLERQGSWDVAAFVEGAPSGAEGLPFCNGEGRRGWLDKSRARGGNMPHNWTTAEVVNFIRDVFVTEENDGLVLGAGVPDAWLVEGARFGVRNMPTDFGEASWSATVGADGTCELEYDGPKPYRTVFPVDTTGTEDNGSTS